MHIIAVIYFWFFQRIYFFPSDIEVDILDIVHLITHRNPAMFHFGRTSL